MRRKAQRSRTLCLLGLLVLETLVLVGLISRLWGSSSSDSEVAPPPQPRRRHIFHEDLSPFVENQMRQCPQSGGDKNDLLERVFRSQKPHQLLVLNGNAQTASRLVTLSKRHLRTGLSVSIRALSVNSKGDNNNNEGDVIVMPFPASKPNVSQTLSWDQFFDDSHKDSPCFQLPRPEEVLPTLTFDMIYIQLPCSEEPFNVSSVSRSPHSLLLQYHLLSFATQVIAGKYTRASTMTNVLIRQCEQESFRLHPFPAFFSCNELVDSETSTGLAFYRAGKRTMESRNTLLGQCMPVPDEPKPLPVPAHKQHFVYATVVLNDDAVCGAIMLGHSLHQTQTRVDRIALVTDVSPESLKALTQSGWRVFHTTHIRGPFAKEGAYNEFSYTKLRVWQLPFDKVVLLESDILVLKNMDHLFHMPANSAIWNGDGSSFSTGIFVVEPALCTFYDMMNQIKTLAPSDGDVQGFLNLFFKAWSRMSWKYSVFKVKANEELLRQNLAFIYSIQFVGMKPWHCYRDYDCNDDESWSQDYAIHSLHKLWFSFYDTLPVKQREVCSLSQDSFHRLQVTTRWTGEIKDPRQLQRF